MSIKELLQVRERLKSKKPNFLVQDVNKRGELKERWRKPKGRHSKLRENRKGHRKMPSQGFRSPVLVRGMHKSGLKIVWVHSVKDVENLQKDAKNVCIIISSGVGQKKTIEIIKKAEQFGIKIVNIKPEEFLRSIEEKKAQKKKEKEAMNKDKKPEKKEEKPAKVEPEKKESEEEKSKEIVEEEERKEAEKKEKDKILTQRLR